MDNARDKHLLLEIHSLVARLDERLSAQQDVLNSTLSPVIPESLPNKVESIERRLIRLEAEVNNEQKRTERTSTIRLALVTAIIAGLGGIFTIVTTLVRPFPPVEVHQNNPQRNTPAQQRNDFSHSNYGHSTQKISNHSISGMENVSATRR